MLTTSLSAPASLVPGAVIGVIFWAAAAACVVAQFFIIRAVVKAVPSVTGSPDVPTPHRAMEIAWAILPGLLILAVFVGAWRLLYPSNPSDLLPTTSRGAPEAPAART